MSPKLRVTPFSPLILDRWLDVAFAVLWGVYACWGITTLIVGLPTITINTPEWYSTVWAGSVGSLAALAFLACLSLFFAGRPNFILKKKIERGAVICLIAFILVYPVLLFAASREGDTDRTSLAVLSVSYIVFPVYRVYVLNKRIKAYDIAVQEIRDVS